MAGELELRASKGAYTMAVATGALTVLFIAVMSMGLGAFGEPTDVGLALSMGMAALAFGAMTAYFAAVPRGWRLRLDARGVTLDRPWRAAVHVPRTALAGVQVHYVSKKALITGAMIGGAIGAMVATSGPAPKQGTIQAFALWERGAKKPHRCGVDWCGQKRAKQWLAAVEALGVPIHHGDKDASSF